MERIATNEEHSNTPGYGQGYKDDPTPEIVSARHGIDIGVGPNSDTGIEDTPNLHQDSPLTFPEAESHGAFRLLTELYEHVSATDEQKMGDPGYRLTELALAAAAVAWWTRWQPIAIHRALLAGASLGNVAAAIGTDESEAYQRWDAWAERQARFVVCDRPGVKAEDVAAIREQWAPRTP
jgi:hypothetical protein